MRDAETRFAGSAHWAGLSWTVPGAAGDGSVFFAGGSEGAAHAFVRPAVVIGLIAAVLASFVALCAPPAWGAYLHTTVIGEYGKEGSKATGVSGGCNVAFHSAANRIYYFADQKIYGLERTGPGTVVPLGGSFPINAAINSSCGDRHMAVDNTGLGSSGNIYAVPSNTSIYAWTSAGTVLSPFPVNVGGETCGVAVNNEGQVWGGNYSAQTVAKYTAAGASAGTIPVGFSLCKIAIDQTNNDLYVAPYNGSAPLAKFTAASGYTTKVNFPATGSGNPGLAVNGAANRIYVASGSTVKSYDTNSGNPVETITPGGTASSVAVDEATDTIFVAPTNGAIKEISGAVVPDITTGEPEGNFKVNGVVEPAGGGEVTECYFEFGTSPSYGSKEFCSPTTPYNANQNVFANLPGLLGEVTYHYRLVAHNANGKNVGTDKTITPHYVVGLQTDPAESVTRTAAKMKAHFDGNGEETHYYFEWGTTTAYGNQSAIPPGDSAGSPGGPTQLSFDATGLQPDTEYHYRVVASNPLGVSPGNDRTFKTLPAIQNLTTNAASDVEARSATLNASYDGDGDATTYYFEYGKTLSYGSTTPVQNAGMPTGTTQLFAAISGLELETPYHYRVVATNSLGTTKGADQTFTTDPAVAGLHTLAATEISQESLKLNAEFEGDGDDTSYYFEYGLTAAYGKVSAAPPGVDAGAPVGVTQVSAVIADFEAYTTYHYRIVATNSQGTTKGADMVFETLPAPLPSITGTAATGVSSTGATMEAEVNPNRWATVYLFEYGFSAAYGESTEISQVIGSDQFMHPIREVVTHLTPGTVYHFRAVAINFTGTAYGPDQTLATPATPEISLTTASNVGESAAHLSASVNPKSAETTVRFEYGANTSYGASTPSSSIGGDAAVHVTGADVSGLAAGTTYHFRTVAENALGTTVGPDQTFRTLPASAQSTPIPRSSKCRRGFVKRKGKCVKRRRRLHRHSTHRHG